MAFGLISKIQKVSARAEPEPAPLWPIAVDDPIPNTLRLGWAYSPDRDQFQMARIANRDRATHCYIVGASGSGKTKFLEFLIQQDLANGEGFGIIDPHGDLIEDTKGFIACMPDEERDEALARVVLVDPTDPEYTAVFNPLERLPGVSASEQAQELISAFRTIWASAWGVRMEDLLRHSLIALSEADGTLADLPDFLTVEARRREVLAMVTHDGALAYFRRFDSTTERARLTWVEPVLNKVNALLADERIHALFSQSRSTFHPRQIMDGGQVLLVKLDKGRLKDAADLLGALLFAKLKMAAFSRSDIPRSRRRPFYLYIDEFQNFASDSFATVLSESRKYGLSLVMAHQTLAQLSPELRSVILGNTGIQVVFRVNRQDAQLLAKEAFEYSGHEVKRAGLRSTTYWSLGEEWELNTHELQSLPPRVCWVKHKIAGGLLSLQTVEVGDPADAFGMSEAEFQQHVASLQIGRAHVVERAVLQQAPVDDAPAAAEAPNVEAAADEPTSESVAPDPTPALDNRLVRYLQDISEHPFSPALERDERLGHSKYQGVQVRRALSDQDLVRSHRVSAGKRSGQLTLLELTSAGEEQLRSVGVRVRRPKGRGGFLHRYYMHRLAEYAQRTWPDATVELERRADGSERYPDVTVLIPTDDESVRSIALEVFMTGETKELRGLAQDVELFDEVYLCAETAEIADSLRKKAERSIPSEQLAKVTFSPIGPFLTEGKAPPMKRKRSASRSNPPSRPSKNGPKPEPERRKSRQRQPSTQLLRRVSEAYAHLHDLDWLQESPLVELDAVRERRNALSPLPEAQALRGLLLEGAKRAAQHAASVPAQAPLATFLARYVEGRRIAEIAEELGVSREWCSRSYRKQALELAGRQFVSLNSVERGSGQP